MIAGWRHHETYGVRLHRVSHTDSGGAVAVGFDCLDHLKRDFHSDGYNFRGATSFLQRQEQLTYSEFDVRVDSGLGSSVAQRLAALPVIKGHIIC